MLHLVAGAGSLLPVGLHLRVRRVCRDWRSLLVGVVHHLRHHRHPRRDVSVVPAVLQAGAAGRHAGLHAVVPHVRRAAHICFSFIAFVAPFSSFYGIPGIMSAMNAYNTSKGLGTIYWLGAALWGAEALFSCYVFLMIYKRFRGQGGHEQVAAASRAGGAFVRFA